MNSSINKLIKQSQNGDKQSLLEITERFKGLIYKYANRSYYEDMSNELLLHLIYIVKNMPSMTEGQSIKYIQTSIKNKYVNTILKEIKRQEMQCYFDSSKDIGIEDSKNLIFNEMLYNLDENKRKILTYKYIHGYSDAEIAKFLNVSRQAINKNKRQALNLLKEKYLLI